MDVIYSAMININEVTGNHQLLQDVCNHIYCTDELAIRAAIQGVRPNEDLDSFEGGINDWFGYGSAMCMELGICIRTTYLEDGILFELLD